MPGIANLACTVENLSGESRSLWDAMFEVSEGQGTMHIPNTFRPKVKQYFGMGEQSEESICQRVRSQKVVRTRNKWTGEEALFNELRASRPGMRQAQMLAERRRVEEKIRETEKDCDFCQPLKYTPEDIFGRVEKEFTDGDGIRRSVWTGANVAKYDVWSGMVYFNRHNPLRFSEQELAAVIDAGFDWFTKVCEADNNARYPFFMWNCLGKAGASQVHGHAQVLMARGKPYAKVRALFEAAERYAKVSYPGSGSWRDYFEDLYKVHESIGLACDFQEEGDEQIRILVNITPVKEKETLILIGGSPARSRDAKRAIYQVLRCFIDDLGVFCFNVSMAMPSIDGSGEVPFCVVRIVDRGSLFKRTADIGGMELYGTSVIETDPYVVVAALKQRL